MDAARARGRVRHRPDRDQPHRERQAVRPSMVAVRASSSMPSAASTRAGPRPVAPLPRPSYRDARAATARRPRRRRRRPVDDDASGATTNRASRERRTTPGSGRDRAGDMPTIGIKTRGSSASGLEIKHQSSRVAARAIGAPGAGRPARRPRGAGARARAYQAVAVAASVMPWASSQRSASMAALQPSPAAVTAWR